MTIPELVNSLHLKTYEYCTKQKIIKTTSEENSPEKLNEIMVLSKTLDEEQISYTIDSQSNFVSLFDHKI